MMGGGVQKGKTLNDERRGGGQKWSFEEGGEGKENRAPYAITPQFHRQPSQNGKFMTAERERQDKEIYA